MPRRAVRLLDHHPILWSGLRELESCLRETKRKTIALVTALALTPTVSFSQDWTGGFAGVQLVAASFKPSEFYKIGTAYGLNAGYRYTFQNGFNLGGELQYDGTSAKAEGIKMKSVFRAKLNLGYDNGGRVLPYVSIGGACRHQNRQSKRVRGRFWHHVPSHRSPRNWR